MSEKLDKALEELNDLMNEVNSVQSEVDDAVTKNAEYMATDDAGEEMDKGEDLEMEEKADEDMDEEAKALDIDLVHSEAGKEVVVNGNPTATPAQFKVSKGLENVDFSTLDLSVENVEKAYAKFKSERMEAMAYDSLSKEFESRFTNELSVKKSMAERAEYDARDDVAALKTEFAELRKSLTERNSEIRKAQEVSMTLPSGFPTSIEAAADMSWDDLHALTRGE